MDARCRIELFGQLRVVQAEQTITRFRTLKAGWLLAYLALHLGRPQARDHLIDLFWQDLELDAARDNLSTTLSSLRRQLEPAGVAAGSVLAADRAQVRLNPIAVSTDVQACEALWQKVRSTADVAARAPLIEQLVRLMPGPLLPGCYDDWALEAQRRWQERQADALQLWSLLLERADRLEEALAAAQRTAQVDPYREEAYQTQMRLYAALGRMSAAQETYRRLETLLDEQLGITPAPETRRLAELLRRDPATVVAALRAQKIKTASSALSKAEELPLQEVANAAPATPSTNLLASPPSALTVSPSLPLQLTRFFGRVREMDDMERLLTDANNRLITLLGPGGIGKTRLSIEAAQRVAGHFNGRVWFIALADLPDPSLIPSALAHALKLPPASGDLDQVIAALSARPCLLVLDNFEHLMRDSAIVTKSENPLGSGSVALVRLLLARVPGLTCLITSRQPLHLGGEQEYALASLEQPSVQALPQALIQCDSVALYTARAQAVKPDFALTANNAAAVAALCRKLEGMPLAIEMAAAWAKALPPHRVLERLERSLDLLVSTRRDLPPRHRSLRATIEWSYALLTPELQRLFAWLSLFRGGWTLTAAEAIVGPEALFGLAELQSHSLIQLQHPEGHGEAGDSEDISDDPRYRMYEPLREFAAEKLQAEGSVESGQRAHMNFFRAFVDEAWGEMNTLAVKPALERLQAELENIRAALTWCEAHDPEAGLHIAAYIWRFWEVRGYGHEGRVRVNKFLELCGDEPPTTDRAQARHAAGALAGSAGDYPNALHHYARAQEIAQALGDRYRIAMAKQQRALVAMDLGDDSTGAALLEEVIAIYEELGERGLVANNLSNLALIAIGQGDTVKARRQLTQALQIQREAGDLRSMAITLNNLGNAASMQGDFDTARSCQAESLRITCELGAKRGSAYAIESFAAIALDEAQWERAIFLWSAGHALREAHVCPLPPSESAELESAIAQIKHRIGAERFGTAWNAGYAASLQQVMDFAIDADNIDTNHRDADK